MLTYHDGNLGLPPLAKMHAHDRILVLLKLSGQSTGAELARKLRITGEGVRQQLLRLANQGLVSSTSEIRGRGRPVQLWRLTPQASRRFPDAHPQLTIKLIELIRKHLGEPALQRLIKAQGKELLAKYAAGMVGVTGLKARLARLAELRNTEGYMAECRAGIGEFLFIQNHCPICAATGGCVSLCEAEDQVFKALLGPEISVTRLEHIRTGSDRCVFQVRQRAPRPTRKTRRARPRNT